MIFTFITDQPDLCEIFMHRLRDENHRCYIQDDWVEFQKSLMHPKEIPNLIICDFSFVGSTLFAIFEIIETCGQKVPVIFYNDPATDDQHRVYHWINQNEYHYRNTFPQELIPELEKINDIINDPSVRKHISLMQPPVPIGYKTACEAGIRKEIDLMGFRRRNKIPPSVFNLFSYMYSNRDRAMTIKELSKALFGTKACHQKTSTIYSYICRLRKFFQNDKQTDMEIYYAGNKSYELIVY